MGVGDCGNPNCVNGWIFDADRDKVIGRCGTCDPDYRSPEERDRIRREEREVKELRREQRRRRELAQAAGVPTEDLPPPRRSLPYKD